MLGDAVKKVKEENPDNIVTSTGTCPFCHQITQFDAPIDWVTEMLDERAAEVCGCVEATIYAGKKRKKEKAFDAIEKKFGEKSGARVDGDVISALNMAAALVVEEKIDKASIKITGALKCDISMNSKGGINIARTITRKEEEKVN